MVVLAVTWSEVLVTLHILAVVVAFGGALAYPVWFRMIRDGTPEERAFFHRAQANLGKIVITPAMLVIFASGAYLASDHDVWDMGWVLIPTVITVVILALGAGLLGPGEERLSRQAKADDQHDYEAILRRVKGATFFAAVLVVAATFLMVARVPEWPAQTAPAGGSTSAGAALFVETGCGSCHTLESAGTRGTRGPNLDEAVAGRSAAKIRAAVADHPQDFSGRLSDDELEALAGFVADKAGSGD